MMRATRQNKGIGRVEMKAGKEKRHSGAQGTIPASFQSEEIYEREVRKGMGGLKERTGARDSGAAQMNRRGTILALMAVLALALILTAGFYGTVDAATAGPSSPTVGSNDSSIGTLPWSNPGNITVSDSVYATVALSNAQISNYLVAKGFNFAIPSGATINGIVAQVTRKEVGSFYVNIMDNSVMLEKAGAVTGSNRAVPGAAWSRGTNEIATYGTATDLWGAAWTPADINDPNFGVAISVLGGGWMGTETAFVDNVMVTVYYTSGGPSCTASAPTVSITTSPQTITTDGGSVTYNVSVTNNDSGAGCSSTTFSLSASDTNSTNFNASSASPASMTLTAGGNGTSTLTVTAKTGQTSGSDSTTVTASASGHTNGVSSAVATTLNVTSPCTAKAPTVSITTSPQTITTDGGSVTYNVSVTNNDSGAGCGSTTFSLSASDTNSTNFNASSASPASVTLTAGGNGTSTLTVTAKAGQTTGSNGTTVTALAAGHANGSNGVTTTLSVTTCTAVVPTLTLSPTAKTITTNGGSVTYTLSATNNDTGAGCTSVKFSFSTWDSDSTNFVHPSTATPSSLTLAPGANGTTTLTVAANAGKTTGTNNTMVIAYRPLAMRGDDSNTVTTTISSAAACTSNAPSLAIAPSSQSVAAGGAYGSAQYTVYVTNNDSGVCTPTTFTLSVVSDSDLTDFNASGLSSTSLTLNAGQMLTATLTASSKSSAASGAADVTAVGVSAAGHTSPSNVTVTTTVNPKSALLHSSDLLGTCSNSAYTNKQDCAAHGATWTPNKWAASGGWGAAGGMYGEFVCETCHTRTTTNIKRIKGNITVPDTSKGNILGSAVLFTSTTTPNGFGDDSDNHTTSQKVCEVCHTITAHHRYNATGQTDGKTHNNNLDCTSCHPHSKGFSPSGGGACDACHGFPPVASTMGGPTGLANAPVTGSTTPGMHSFHATASGRNFACGICHYNSVGSGATHDDTKISLGFVNILGPSTYTGGAYDGQTTANYESTDAGTTVSKTGTKSCSNIYCHGSTMAPNGGTNTSPVWDNAATAACGTCHGATVANPPTRGSHVTHAGTSRALPCSDCHKGYVPATIPSGMATHVNNQADFAFDTTKNYIGASSTYSGTPAMLDAYGNCSNLYCHSNVQTSPPGGALTYATPTWGNAASGACGTCHGGNTDPGKIASGSHSKHVTTTTYNFACSQCHNGAGEGTTKHADHNVDVAFSGAGTYSGSPTPGDAYGSCSNTYCHGDGTGGTLNSGDTRAISASTSPVWGSSTTCGSCHGGGNATGQPSYPSGSPKANSHSIHPTNCSLCHYATTTTGTTITGFSAHNNQLYDLQANTSAGVSFSYSYSPSGGSCSSISCHGNGNATWGATVGCGGCHAIPPATGAHATHIQDASLITKAYGNTEVVSNQNNYAFGCGNCHPTDPSKHGNGVVDISLNSADGGQLKSLNNVSNNTSGYSQTTGTSVICSAAYCHSDGKGTFGTTPNWYGGSFAGDRCANCHLNSPNSAYHAKHVVGIHYYNIYTGTTGLASAGTLVTNSHGNATSSTTINCNVCHNNTVTSSANDQNTVCAGCHNGTNATLHGNGAIANKAFHVNGTVDVKFDEVNLIKSKAQIRDSITSVPELNSNWSRNANSYKTGATPNDTAQSTLNTAANWNSATKTCSSVACHNGNKVKLTDTVSCASCHTALP